jgi:hypothetical protein
MLVQAVFIYLPNEKRIRVHPQGGYDIEQRVEGCGWILDNEAKVNDRSAICRALSMLQSVAERFIDCPSCHTKGALTTKEQKNGYQCQACEDAEEGGL